MNHKKVFYKLPDSRGGALSIKNKDTIIFYICALKFEACRGIIIFAGLLPISATGYDKNDKFMILPLFLSSVLLAAPAGDAGPAEETALSDTLSGAVLVSDYKQVLPVGQVASPVTGLNMAQMDTRGIDDIKKLSSLVPNLHIPDYGSSMTSSVYLRGFGSRIDNPVIGLYIDDIPVMNKNSYDTGMYDISSAMLLRGPQSTLYGRNSMCGVLSLTTLSPENCHESRISLEYGNANSVLARLSVCGKSGFGASVAYRHTDGFYLNTYDNEYVDRSDALNFRFRVWKQLRRDLIFENILSASLTDQGGYPYREYDPESGDLAPVAYNDPCRYRRLNVTEGLKFKYMSENWTLNSVTSLQFLADKMVMDQDFTTRSMFTLAQEQLEGAVTQELILKPEGGWRKSWWNWQTGFFAFGKYNDMSAPVRFKHDGIQELILDNANAGLSQMGASLLFQEDEFDIPSDFGIATAGAALYHESYFMLGRWTLTAGIRFDYEWSGMDYDSRAVVHYTVSPFMGDRYIPCESVYSGREDISYLEIMPKLSALYDFGAFKLFATFSEGYKSGGFNTQIFSDILQNKLMAELMKDSPVTLPESSVGADDTVYKPERSLNVEVGTRFSFSRGQHNFRGTASIYSIMCLNQQITVFPTGTSTGRMMANAGNSRSIGAEAEFGYGYRNFSMTAAYGFCDARFTNYNDGLADYKGKRIPYSPAHTLNARVQYRWDMDNDYFRSITAGVEVSALGKIWWDEANTLSQPFYAVLGADVRGHFKWFDIFLRGENLTDSRYAVFYFKSVGKSFFQMSKPLRLTVGVSVSL